MPNWCGTDGNKQEDTGFVLIRGLYQFGIGPLTLGQYENVKNNGIPG